MSAVTTYSHLQQENAGGPGEGEAGRCDQYSVGGLLQLQRRTGDISYQITLTAATSWRGTRSSLAVVDI